MEQINWTTVIIGFAVGWVITKFIQGYMEAKNQMLEAEIEALTKKVKQLVVRVNVEKHGDMFYLFEKETDQFVAQGRDLDEIKQILQTRFPQKTFFADDDAVKNSGLSL